MLKTTLREIKSSLGRYMAILLIIALGVGFYGGLKCTKPAMIKTLDTYLKNSSFFDYRFLSTIGFDKDTPDYIMNLGNPDIASAEGSYFVDALCQKEGGEEIIYKLHSITSSVNKLYMVEGRMPENTDECVIDNYMINVKVGDVINVTDNNSEDTLDLLKEHTLKVVGIARSPYYINFERGTTSIGTGKVSGFIYVPEDIFDADYYSEIFIKLKNDFGAYTDEYDDYIESKEDSMEELADEVTSIRFDRIYDEAKEELDDAREEFDKESADGRKELDDALEELEEGRTKIDDAQKEIDDGLKDIEDAKKKLSSQERKLNDSEVEANNKLNELKLGYISGVVPLADFLIGRQQLEAGLAQIDSGRNEISKARRTIKEQEKEINDGIVELEDARKEWEEGYAEYEDGLKEYNEKVADAQKELDDAKAELEDIEEPLSYSLNRKTNVGYACYESDTNIVASVANVFPIFFFLVALLICMTTMNRMVEEQRTQIGILKALGYSSFSILNKYTFYAGSAALVGAAGGYLAGTYFLPQAIWQGYNIMYNMGPTIEYKSVTMVAVLSVAAAMLCAVGSAYFSVIYELKDVPANLIRPKAPKSGKRVFLEYITPLWKHMKFLHKVTARNILRYKKRFFMMVLGIGGCTALVLTGFGIGDSIKGIADRQYTTIQKYDISVTFSDDFDNTKIEEVLSCEGLENAAFTREESVDAYFNGEFKTVTSVLPRNKDELLKFLVLRTEDGVPIDYPTGNEAVISARFASNLGINVGDTIELRDSDLNERLCVVSGICENYVYSYVYLPEDNTLDSYNTAWINAGDDLHKLGAAIASFDYVLSVSIIDDLRERIDTMMSGMDFIVLIVIMCAGALALIVLYNLTNINITERIREIATIKVLGFYPGETASYVFRENLVLTAIGALVGLPLGKALHAFIMYTIRIDMVSFKTYVAPISYVWAIAITFGFAFLVNGIMYFKLDKINMAESLKTIE